MEVWALPENKMFTTALCFDDVLLQPQFSEIESRTTIDIGNHLGDNFYTLPIISAPMDTVTESEMAAEMSWHGGLGIIHRYNSPTEQAQQVEPSTPAVGGSIGVTGGYLARAKTLLDAGARILCVDVAHGHHSLMKDALQNLKESFPDTHIMAGNVATAQAFKALAKWGADSIKVGIGGGSICSTRIQTGHGVPTLQSILDCREASVQTGVKLIADGGIKNSGDIVKALAAGADFVMLGSLLAGTTESPGEVYHTKNGPVKVYRGMASKEAQGDWKGSYSSHEGISTVIPHKGPIHNILEDLRRGITSGFSYSGAKNLTELQEHAKFIRQTTASCKESNTHILEVKDGQKSTKNNRGD